jgi:shikimate 5-dehydrogenase
MNWATSSLPPQVTDEENSLMLRNAGIGRAGDGVTTRLRAERRSVSVEMALKGKVAIITGASRGGVGEACAIALAREGAKVVQVARPELRRRPPRVLQLAGQAGQSGGIGSGGQRVAADVLYDAADDLSREAIAAVMSRIRLNATATPTPLRPPLLNAKRWATLDLISRGSRNHRDVMG